MPHHDIPRRALIVILPTRNFLLGMLASLGLFLLMGEGLCRWVTNTGFLYDRMNPVVDITSRPETMDRLRWGSDQPQPLYLLGDSVLGPTAMTQKRLPDSRSNSLSHHLDLLARSSGACAVNLGCDGLLLTDIEALTEYLGQGGPKRVLLLLNFRMFAPEFESGKTSVSRPYLNLHEVPVDSAARIESFLLRHSALFRVTRLLRTLWYQPSQKDFFQRILENTLHLESDPDIQQAALVMKVTPYYPSKTWDPKGAPFQSLERVISNLRTHHIPVMVVLTPQNPSFFGKRFDLASFDANRRLLQTFFQKGQAHGFRYLDWATHYPPTDFLDHCHLTAEGNARYAKDLWNVLQTVSPPEPTHE